MKMISRRRWLLVCMIVVCVGSGFAQKIRIGFDKSVDFSKYKTYTWAKSETPIMRPLLYDNVVAIVDSELKSRGLQRTEKDGDLKLVAAGGIGFGYNMPPAAIINAAYWGGKEDTALLTAPMVAGGTLILEFIDQSGKMIWRGTATENLDPELAKSLPRIEKAIVKLVSEYPPKHSSN
jgi:Domain of unknown function (DUF4136)